MRSLIVFTLLVAIVDISFAAAAISEKSSSEAIASVTPEGSKLDEAVQLEDTADIGASHANEGDRNARLIGLGFGGFGGFGGYGYRPYYRPYYRPWGYRPWGYGGYGYGHRPWGGYHRPYGGYFYG